MFFADLTPYSHAAAGPLGRSMLNIGWLSPQHPFAMGESPPALLSALRQLVASPAILTCGHHNCEFCPPPVIGRWDGPIEALRPNRMGTRTSLPGTTGNGEIWVRARNGVVYRAPVLVAHYVDVHKYLPPAVFVNAVLACAGA
jgi:hypothetical protein